MTEYDLWSKRVDEYIKDAKASADDKKELITNEWNKLREKISAKIDLTDEFFAPYKEKIIAELEKMWLEKWQAICQPTPA
jgi:hypothetical protein